MLSVGPVSTPGDTLAHMALTCSLRLYQEVSCVMLPAPGLCTGRHPRKQGPDMQLTAGWYGRVVPSGGKAAVLSSADRILGLLRNTSKRHWNS